MTIEDIYGRHPLLRMRLRLLLRSPHNAQPEEVGTDHVSDHALRFSSDVSIGRMSCDRYAILQPVPTSSDAQHSLVLYQPDRFLPFSVRGKVPEPGERCGQRSRYRYIITRRMLCIMGRA